MTTPTMIRFERTGYLLVDPQAFSGLYPSEETQLVAGPEGPVAIVDICGPIVSSCDGSGFSSYDGIRARVQSACKSASRVVLLRINSPGGEASGCFDCSRALASDCALAGKRLVAFVSGSACSAAYALAVAADAIYLTDTSVVGSIGAIRARVDVSEMNARNGVRVLAIASGARKADGSPDIAVTDDELRATQEIIDSMGAVFFELVAIRRRVSADQIRQMEARTYHAASAVSVGLADGLTSFDELLLKLSAVQPEPAKETVMNLTEVMEALAALAAGPAGDDADKAKKMLGTLVASVDPVDGDPTPDPESDPGVPPKKDDDEKDKMIASLQAQISDRDLKDQREVLFARYGASVELRASLADQASMEHVESVLKAAKSVKPPAVGTVQVLHGETKPLPTKLAAHTQAELDAAFGKSSQSAETLPFRQTFVHPKK